MAGVVGLDAVESVAPDGGIKRRLVQETLHTLMVLRYFHLPSAHTSAMRTLRRRWNVFRGAFLGRSYADLNIDVKRKDTSLTTVIVTGNGGSCIQTILFMSSRSVLNWSTRINKSRTFVNCISLSHDHIGAGGFGCITYVVLGDYIVK